MQPKSETRAYFWLGRSEPKTAAGGLRRAVDEGVLLPQDFAETISGCRTCSDPVACQNWLAANDVPKSCRNASLIAELRAI